MRRMVRCGTTRPTALGASPKPTLTSKIDITALGGVPLGVMNVAKIAKYQKEIPSAELA
jgi:hypothetical protein